MASVIDLGAQRVSNNKNRLAIVKPSSSILSFPINNDIENPNTAIIYCEGNFGAADGKTANGLVRHSEKYKILSVIDSDNAGLDSGVVLGDAPNNIQIGRAHV